MYQSDIFGTKPKTKAKKVEEALIAGGWAGVSNGDLNQITYRYGAVIFNMREKGHIIVTGPTDKFGKVTYYYQGKK